MDAIDVDNEECKKALQIKQSWKELADTITLHDTFDPLGYAWLSKRGMYPGRMWMLVALVAGVLQELLHRSISDEYKPPLVPAVGKSGKGKNNS